MKNPYIPKLAIIRRIKDETPNTRTFRLTFKDPDLQRNFKFSPGQFIELTVFNYGEAPFSISSSPLEREYLETTIRVAGTVTKALFSLKENDVIGIRGPFGNSWPMGKLKGENVLIIAGGIGLAPLRPVIKQILSDRDSYGEVILLYGARTPKDLLYKEELKEWEKQIDVHLIVDVGDETWKGRTGVVTALFDEISVDPKSTYSLQCGPPIMMHFVTKKLVELGFSGDRIVFSLERLMKCGMGFCGHCMISGRYVCRDGPVFNYSQISNFLEVAL